MLQSRLLAKGALASAAAVMAVGAFAAVPTAAAAHDSGYYGSGDGYSDCQDHKTGGTVAGAVIGGVLGAVVGGNVAERGDRGGGAVIGGALGAVAGGAVGNSSVNCGDGYSSQPAYDQSGYGYGNSDAYAPAPNDGYGYGYDQSAPPADAYGNSYDYGGLPPADAQGGYYGGDSYQAPYDPYYPRR